MKEDWIYKRGDLYYANLNPYLDQSKAAPVLSWFFKTMWGIFLSHFDRSSTHQ